MPDSKQAESSIPKLTDHSDSTVVSSRAAKVVDNKLIQEMETTRQTNARHVVADLLSSTILQNTPELAFCKNNENPLLEIQNQLRSMEGALQDSPEVLAFMIEFTQIYNRALKNDKNRKTSEIKSLRKDLSKLSDFLDHVKQEVKDTKSLHVPEEYEVIIDALRNHAAMGRLGPLSNVARQIVHWAEHTKEELQAGLGIGKPLSSKLWRCGVALGLVGAVGAGTVMMYANYQPPTTIKIDPIVTGYENISFDENGQMDFDTQYNSDKRVESLKLGCHSHVKAATFGNEKLADLAVKHVFKDEQAYQDCIVIGETSQSYYSRFDMPAYTARDKISSVLPDTQFKESFNNGVNDTHDFWKLANNVENAVVHPLISQFHLAAGTKIAFGSLMLLWTLAGLRERENKNGLNHPSMMAMTMGHINANRLRYGAMSIAAGSVIATQMDASFGGIVSKIPHLINYSVGGLLAGDAAKWTINKFKKKDYIEAVPFAQVKANLQSFSHIDPVTPPTSWRTHINAKNTAYGACALTVIDTAFFGGQGTGFALGAALSTATDLPYIFIEDIPIHLPFAVVGEAAGITIGTVAGAGAGLYLAGKKMAGHRKSPDDTDTPSI